MPPPSPTTYSSLILFLFHSTATPCPSCFLHRLPQVLAATHSHDEVHPCSLSDPIFPAPCPALTKPLSLVCSDDDVPPPLEDMTEHVQAIKKKRERSP